MTITLADLPAPPADKSGWPWTVGSPPPAVTLPEGADWPRLSIVTPSYNQAQYLEATIRSVLLQGYPALEYVVIDGGSTDGSVAILQKYDAWITQWVSEADRGQSHAINKGFDRTTGPIMAWLNSDDMYQPGVFHRVAAALHQQAHTMLIGASILTAGPETLAGRFDQRQPAWEEMAYDSRTFPQPSVFWTRDLWQAAGPLDESLFFAMDYDLWLKMRPHAAQEIFVDDALSYARIHADRKGHVARPDGGQQVDVFRRQRAYVSLRAARLRGESGIVWLLKVWARRVANAVQNRSLARLRHMEYPVTATQVAFDTRFGRQRPAFGEQA